MHRAFFDWNNAIRSLLVMPHDQAAAAESRTEDECNFLPEMPGTLGILIYRNKQRRGHGAVRFTQWLSQRRAQTVQQQSFFRSELLGIRKMLDAAAAADPEMTT